MTPEILEREVRQLRDLVDCLMIAREGIPELEGAFIDLYNDADRYLTHKTIHLRDRKIRDKEKAQLEEEIRQLQDRLSSYD